MFRLDGTTAGGLGVTNHQSIVWGIGHAGFLASREAPNLTGCIHLSYGSYYIVG